MLPSKLLHNQRLKAFAYIDSMLSNTAFIGWIGQQVFCQGAVLFSWQCQCARSAAQPASIRSRIPGYSLVSLMRMTWQCGAVRGYCGAIMAQFIKWRHKRATVSIRM